MNQFELGRIERYIISAIGLSAICALISISLYDKGEISGIISMLSSIAYAGCLTGRYAFYDENNLDDCWKRSLSPLGIFMVGSVVTQILLQEISVSWLLIT